MRKRITAIIAAFAILAAGGIATSHQVRPDPFTSGN